MKKIAVLAGDGIGPEVMAVTIEVLQALAKKQQYAFEFIDGLIGGAAYDEHQEHFPAETRAVCERADAILFGSVGGPVTESHAAKWQDCERNSILALRKAFSINANFRPARVYPQLRTICPLKDSIIADGVDLLVVRELSGDIYFGEHKRFLSEGKRQATDVAEYDEDTIAKIAHAAFDAAKKRKKKVTSVDKANVLATSQLWREVVQEVAKEYPEVACEHMLVDNCAMQLIVAPAQFDVILTANLFGDILSDAAAVLPGSLGLMASASFNAEGFGLYEPSGGSAPDLRGRNVANPIAQILSAALMLRFSFGLEDGASAVESAVQTVLDKGLRTKDIWQDGDTEVTTSAMAEAIIAAL